MNEWNFEPGREVMSDNDTEIFETLLRFFFALMSEGLPVLEKEVFDMYGIERPNVFLFEPVSESLPMLELLDRLFDEPLSSLLGLRGTKGNICQVT